MIDRTVVASGVPIHVREEGSGEPVVLLHGFPQTGECWSDVAARLAGNRRVIVPDLPGFGRSGRPPSYEGAAVADVLAALLDELGASPATIVGHDWGGSLAFALALAHPDRVSNLVVSNAPFRKLDLKRGFHFLAFNVPVVPELAFRVAGDRLVGFMLRAGAARKEVFDDERIRPYREAYADPANVRSALAYYRTITRKIIARRIRPGRGGAATGGRRITAPTLLVWGMEDPVLTETVLAGIERDIPHARSVRLTGCGHFVPEECPEEIAGAIESFLTTG
ncbi:MAG: alpha/beta fold hydrolase [Actinomycetota bacterium]